MKLRHAILAALLWVVVALPASAHEIRPAYLEIHESTAGQIDILWKQPVVGDLTLPISPHVSAGWLEEEAARVVVTDTALVREWHVVPPHAPLAGQTLTIEGLEVTLTDVLVEIRNATGAGISRVISPASPRLRIPEHGASSLPVWRYLWLGVTHIWSGTDHLLYVFGLILLVAAVRPLLLTLTSFTAAHSITLALTTLDLVRVPTAPVEAAIALSIVYLAAELLRQARGEAGWASSRPWLIAFPFGLLHGFGFAGALHEVGLPANDIPTVLLLFNLGLEAGQIAFVVGVLSLAALARKLRPFALTPVRHWASYALGGVASYWLIERMLQI